MNSNGLWKNFCRSWQQHTALQLATLAVLMGSFAVIFIAMLAHHNMDLILSRWGNSIEMSVYLEDGIEVDHLAEIESKLSKSGNFSRVTYVSKEKAAKSFTEKMQNLVPDLLNDKEFGNPLPSSFELKLPERFAAKGGMKELLKVVKEIESLAGIEEVSYGQGWVENYAAVVSSFKWTSFVVVLVLLLGALFVIGNSIRSSISQRREEIEIMELFGATASTIQTPFIFEGAVLGLIAALISVFVSYLMFSWQVSLFGGNLAFWGLESTLSFLTLPKIVFFLVCAMVAGTLASFLCVRRLNKGWAAAEGMGR